MLRGALVVPDVSAASMAATAVIVDALKAAESPIGCTETGGRYQRGQVGHRRLLDGRRQSGLAHGGQEPPHALFKRRQVGCRILCRLPSISEALTIMIADDGVLFSFRSR